MSPSFMKLMLVQHEIPAYIASAGDRPKCARPYQTRFILAGLNIVDMQSTPGIQAAAALGSFGCGSPDQLSPEQKHDAVVALLRIIFSSEPRVVEAGVRALKLIYQSGQQLRRLASLPPRIVRADACTVEINQGRREGGRCMLRGCWQTPANLGLKLPKCKYFLSDSFLFPCPPTDNQGKLTVLNFLLHLSSLVLSKALPEWSLHKYTLGMPATSPSGPAGSAGCGSALGTAAGLRRSLSGREHHG
eukprot:scaffold145569_cov19-Tisochrysis_lutea.AAC.1